MSVTGSWAGGGGSFGVLVHGGAGDLPAQRRNEQAEACRPAADAAAELLSRGGSALDAVQCAVTLLEDDPRFNAGTGACLTRIGTLELDAAIMDGESLRAGGVCAMPAFKNPIAVARAVLEAGGHVLYAGSGAAEFAQRAGFARAVEAQMTTGAARAGLARFLASGESSRGSGGTVGAVARDRAGRVAAATSTGGMIGKAPGRVGDSAVIGAGTYADNLGGAASATGQGEGILRVALTVRLVDALRAGVSAVVAVESAIAWLGQRTGATGGVIAVGASGELALARSTRTMAWAARWEGSEGLCGM